MRSPRAGRARASPPARSRWLQPQRAAVVGSDLDRLIVRGAEERAVGRIGSRVAANLPELRGAPPAQLQGVDVVQARAVAGETPMKLLPGLLKLTGFK